MNDNWIAKIMQTAISQKSSDIYILPSQTGFRLLSLTDGVLSKPYKLNANDGQKLMSYFKYRANMAVSEHRRPQMGAMKWPIANQIVYLRLSSVGDYQGRESLVIRLIYQLHNDYQLLIDGQWTHLQRLCSHRGMVIFAGPMGSGKTTTMYRLGRQFARSEVVMTIEDPVEIDEPSFIQLQVNELAQMDYESLIRVGLRHRPAVFIIGEIRDQQTALMTVRAALSGHLVLATVHAQNTGGVVNRLRQLGVEEAYLQQTLSGICYQRLIPTCNGQAVLFDLLDSRCKWTKMMGGMTDGWRENLQQAAKAGKIKTTTAQIYQEG